MIFALIEGLNNGIVLLAAPGSCMHSDVIYDRISHLLM
jgi:hypothetical protein